MIFVFTIGSLHWSASYQQRDGVQQCTRHPPAAWDVSTSFAFSTFKSRTCNNMGPILWAMEHVTLRNHICRRAGLQENAGGLWARVGSPICWLPVFYITSCILILVNTKCMIDICFGMVKSNREESRGELWAPLLRRWGLTHASAGTGGLSSI